MAKYNERELDEKIAEIQFKLKQFGYDVDIHTFPIRNNYRKKLEDYKNLTFSIDRKLSFNKNSKQYENEDNIEKITNFAWGGEGNAYSNRLVCITNKGNVYVFNSDKGNIICNFNCGTILNAVAIEQTENQMFAVGGFDGAIHLMNIVSPNEQRDNDQGDKGGKKFTGHQGCVSAIQFMSTSFMISASFDSVLLLWDLNSQGKIFNSYLEHTSEISGLDVNEVNGNIFATGSGDTTAKLWDIREKKACVATFQGSDSSVNCVKFLPGSLSTLAAGSEDSIIRLYDLRTVKELGSYKQDKNDNNSVNSIGFSKSGSILFSSTSENNTISFWSLFGKETPCAKYNYSSNHEANSGISRTCINSDKTKIGFIDVDEIVIIK